MTDANPVPVVTVDGPSGSGKGTIGRAVARALGWHFLDSGALYRLLAFAAGQAGVALDDIPALVALATELDIRFSADDDIILLNNQDVTKDIRSEAAGNAASKVAAIPAVREALLARQRAFRQPPGLVADGRDMGTVVFPDADAKIFLDASAEERARRRHKQLIEKGLDANLSALVQEIAERDARDRNRAVAPLRPADDAVVIDTSSMDIATAIERVMAIIRERIAQ